MAGVTPGIITQGLGGNASNLIVGHFHLGFISGVIVIPPPVGGGGAGPRPIPIRYDLDDRDDYPPEQKISVTVKVRFGQVWYERIYLVLPKNAKIMIKIMNLLNTTRSRIKFVVSGVQNKMKSVIATISNITNKSDKE